MGKSYYLCAGSQTSRAENTELPLNPVSNVIILDFTIHLLSFQIQFYLANLTIFVQEEAGWLSKDELLKKGLRTRGKREEKELALQSLARKLKETQGPMK